MWAAKLSQRNCPVDAAEMKAHQGKGVEPQRVNIPDEDFQVKGEPLYGGKGKRSGLIYNHCDFHPLDTHKHAGEQPSPSTITDTAFSEVSETTAHAGPNQPRLQSSNSVVLGKAKKQMHRKNKQRQQALRAEQTIISPWTQQQGLMDTVTPTDHTACLPHRNSMFPNGLALQHPAAEMLKDWATFGCPTHTGKPWTKEEMWEAVARGPHSSARSPEAIAHFKTKAAEKVRTKQARLVLWDSIKDNPPNELKISLIAAIPHKSKDFRSILDLSFRLRLKNGGIQASVNDTTEKTAPAGAIDQIGECLSRIIHAFAEADDEAKIFMAKWDIKDGFW